MFDEAWNMMILSNKKKPQRFTKWVIFGFWSGWEKFYDNCRKKLY